MFQKKVFSISTMLLSLLILASCSEHAVVGSQNKSSDANVFTAKANLQSIPLQFGNYISRLVVNIPPKYSPSKFYVGYCTRYVADKKGGTEWLGNAYAWYANAQAAGVAVGTDARVGAIVVFPVSNATPLGHVGIVTKIENGVVYMSSMNDLCGTSCVTNNRDIRNFPNSKKPVAPTGYIYYKLDKS